MIEDPKLPAENYQALLRHGASKGLPLQAFEVAELGGSSVKIPMVGLAIFSVVGIIALLWAVQ
jgi:hypothetical protein